MFVLFVERTSERRSIMKLRTHDFGWILFFAAIAWFGPVHTVPEATMLTLMAVFQLVEPRVAAFAGTAPTSSDMTAANRRFQ